MVTKYIVFQYQGLPTPVVFPSFIEHADVQIKGAKPLSAGFCHIVDKNEVYVSGKSLSLNLETAEGDAQLIAKLLK